MTLPSPLELSALGTAFAVAAGLIAWLLHDIKLALYVGVAAGACFLAAGVAHTYKQQGVDEQLASDKPVMERATAQLKADTDSFNQIAQLETERKAENERQASLMRSRLADDAVHAAALDVQRDNAEAEAAKYLALYHDALARIALPGVRDAYDIAARGGSDRSAATVAPPNPGGSPAPGAAPVDAATFASACIADVEAHNRLADWYDRLYRYAADLFATCTNAAPTNGGSP